MTFETAGYVVLPHDDRVLKWAQAAAAAVAKLDTQTRRHGATWFVGVDALPNESDGSIDGVPLCGAWDDLVQLPDMWHPAQVSIVYPGYPGKDDTESDAAHRFRRDRDAAHLDGLLPEGQDKRRHLREPHGFILGLPLNNVSSSPLVVWPESHRIIKAAFAKAFAGIPADKYGDVDVTEIYQAARRRVFESCDRVEVVARPGETTLMHRHLIHGVAPWQGGSTPRTIAYFRPMIDPANWV